MEEMDRLVIEQLRASAERHRRLAQFHDAVGELQKAWDCRAMADLEEARAERLERRSSAA
jgi:hypothetical protein